MNSIKEKSSNQLPLNTSFLNFSKNKHNFLKFLEGNFKAFSRDRIAQPILERVIRNHVHKVEVSHLTDINDALTSALPRKAKLYTKKQLSDKFILILEGRAVITIGQVFFN